ncbi:MAG: MaoC family dehydratase N-terminal domain-containing protein [Pseudomonadota bacterium]
MSNLIDDEMRKWIGREDPEVRMEVTRRDIVKYAIATEQQQEKYLRGDEAPPMFLFAADRPLRALDELGPDGLPTDGMGPPLPLKRVMAGGTKQRYYRAIKAGDVLILKRKLTDMFEKQGSSGPLIFLEYLITVTTEDGELVLEETMRRINR